MTLVPVKDQDDREKLHFTPPETQDYPTDREWELAQKVSKLKNSPKGDR